MRLVPVPTIHVHEAWGHIERFVDEATKETGSTQSVEEWQTRCLEGSAQLWLTADGDAIVGCVITEIYNTPRGKTCAFPIAWGELSHVDHVFEAVKPWALEHGCVRRESVCRPGWVRALKSKGWRQIATVIEAEI